MFELLKIILGTALKNAPGKHDQSEHGSWAIGFGISYPNGALDSGTVNTVDQYAQQFAAAAKNPRDMYIDFARRWDASKNTLDKTGMEECAGMLQALAMTNGGNNARFAEVRDQARDSAWQLMHLQRGDAQSTVFIRNNINDAIKTTAYQAAQGFNQDSLAKLAGSILALHQAFYPAPSTLPTAMGEPMGSETDPQYTF